MNLIEYKKINADTFSLNLNENEITYKLSKDFNQSNISYRTCFKILKDFNYPTSILFLTKLISTNFFYGMSEILVDEDGNELTTEMNIKFCINFINLVVFTIENDMNKLNNEIVENYNSSARKIFNDKIS